MLAETATASRNATPMQCTYPRHCSSRRVGLAHHDWTVRYGAGMACSDRTGATGEHGLHTTAGHAERARHIALTPPGPEALGPEDESRTAGTSTRAARASCGDTGGLTTAAAPTALLKDEEALSPCDGPSDRHGTAHGVILALERKTQCRDGAERDAINSRGAMETMYGDHPPICLRRPTCCVPELATLASGAMHRTDRKRLSFVARAGATQSSVPIEQLQHAR